MEGQGPEVKRPRLEIYNDGSYRMQQQPPLAPSHSYQAHPPPPPRNHHSHGGPPHPQSPYYDSGPHEYNRALPDPTGYTQSHSGHNTPAREQRHYAPESYSRRGSASASTRSPDGYQTYPTTRPLNSAGTNDGQYSTNHTDGAGHAIGYPNHDGLMNGSAHHGLPMPAYPENSHTISPAVAPGRPDYSQSPVSATPHPYSAGPYGPQPAYVMQRSKKGNRATQACDVCRQRKAKCDEGRPKCSFCVENNMPCNYQNVAPAKADRANQAIMDHLTGQDHHLRKLKEQQERHDQTLDRIEVRTDQKLERFETMISPLQASMERIEKFLYNSGTPALTNAVIEGPERRSISRQPNSIESPKRRLTPDQKVPPQALSQKSGYKEPKVEASPSGSHATTSTSADTVPTEVNSAVAHINVPVEHYTAAHRLLSWPSIKKLIRQQRILKDDIANEDYVMKFEEERGVLRVYGVGEGRDAGDGGQPGTESPAPLGTGPNSIQHIGSPSGRSDEATDTSSPTTPPEGLWGYGFVPPVTTPNSDPNFDFSLNVYPMTLRRLLDSYLENIYVLHPFFDKPRLTRMIERFSLRYNPGPTEQRLTKSLFPTPASNASVDALRGAPLAGKRKHADGYTQSFATESGHAPAPQKREILFERSISTAIVLLVMALGRICEWKDPLPGLPDPSRRNSDVRGTPGHGAYHQSPLSGNSQSSPAHSVGMSPPGSARMVPNISAPSPANLYRNSLPSPRSNTDDPLTTPRNIDIIPGLAYYAPATDILGNLHGSNDLAHVQAYLLAGLYVGQLARTFESFKWISSACVACRFLVRDPSLRKEKDPRKNMIKFAFWACSQLESDILAELDLPRSGIQDIRDVSYPNDYVEPGDYHHWDSDKLIMGYYSGQIHIRNALNDIQQDLYAPENLDRATKGFALRNAFMETLRGWRKALPPELEWEDTEDPSTDINAARLRGKYYGATYIIHRPFLRYALEQDLFVITDSPNIGSQSQGRKTGVMAPPDTAVQLQNSEIQKSCKACIDAARQSTIAFDGILSHRRLIVTNIFGTAHAQFGNILVLAATYKSKSPTLSSLVSAPTLSHLFDRTINFLHGLEALSDTLKRDAVILKALRESVFDPAAPTQSFSSMDS